MVVRPFHEHGWSVNRARKTTMLIFTPLCVSPVVFAAATHTPWVAVALIALAASAHQAWSANVFSLAGDMFPRRIVGSVTGLGGFAGSVGGIVLFIIVRPDPLAAIARGEPGNYFLIFLAAGLTYVIALLVIHLFAPKPSRPKSRKRPQPENPFGGASVPASRDNNREIHKTRERQGASLPPSLGYGGTNRARRFFHHGWTRINTDSIRP